MITEARLTAAGTAPAAPSTPAERLVLWCDRLPSPVPEMLRTLAAEGERFMEADQLAVALGKKPTGGHWNSGIAVLRNNGLIETEPGSAQGSRRYRGGAAARIMAKRLASPIFSVWGPMKIAPSNFAG